MCTGTAGRFSRGTGSIEKIERSLEKPSQIEGGKTFLIRKSGWLYPAPFRFEGRAFLRIRTARVAGAGPRTKSGCIGRDRSRTYQISTSGFGEGGSGCGETGKNRPEPGSGFDRDFQAIGRADRVGLQMGRGSE